MADNLTTGTTLATPPSGSVVATRQVSYSGDTAHIAPVGIVAFAGSDDAKTATDIPGDAANGLDVDVTRVSGTVTVAGSVNAVQSGTWTVQPGNTANTTAWKVDGSAVTQPVSGTVSITANSTVDLNKIAGTATDVNSGNKSAGTLRVVIATDQPALTNKLLVTPDSVALPANQSVNVSQINGVAPLMGAGNTGTGSHRVTIATDQVAVATTPAGNVAHDGVDSGNPVKVGAKCSLTLSDDTIVSNADRTDLTSDGDGAILVRGQFPLGDLISEQKSNTDGASTAFTGSFAAAGAGVRLYVTGVTVLRTDAGTSMAYVDFRDGTAGSILWTLPLPPNGGAVLPAGALPYFRTSTNTALALDVSSALTTVYLSVTGFKSKV